MQYYFDIACIGENKKKFSRYFQYSFFAIFQFLLCKRTKLILKPHFAFWLLKNKIIHLQLSLFSYLSFFLVSPFVYIVFLFCFADSILYYSVAQELYTQKIQHKVFQKWSSSKRSLFHRSKLKMSMPNCTLSIEDVFDIKLEQ
jgi:fatty acid desaturase